MATVTNSQVEGGQRPSLVELFVASFVEADWTQLKILLVLVTVQVPDGCDGTLGVIRAGLALGSAAHHPVSTSMS